MTSLIDVIFLLLLFFMLSSTFSRFADVEMDLGGAGASGAPPDRIAFLRLGADWLDLNGSPVGLDAVPDRVVALDTPVLVVSVDPTTNAQRLTDLLVALRDVPDVDVVLLGEG